MTNPSLVLYDDAIARGWEPFALTRPAGELLFGTLTLRERAERCLGAHSVLHLAADHLRGFAEAGSPPVGSRADVRGDTDRIFWLSRAVPAWGAEVDWSAMAEGPLRIGETVVGWYAPAGRDDAGVERLGTRADAHAPELRGAVLEHPWDLVSRNPDQVRADIAALHPSPAPPQLPVGVFTRGDDALILGEGVLIEPGVVFDLSQGPIWLDHGTEIRALTRLAGPTYIGPDSRIVGGSVSAVSTGPVCRVHGELSETICLGYVNKQHEGHMGHAYLGRWVNLGAGTNNSDLKNNYGTVRLWTPDREVDTGEVKMGSLLGDHVKTGIGLLLNTGTVIGAGSNLFGPSMPPKYVPPFSWGTGNDLVAYRADRFLEVAERAMNRRGLELSSEARAQLECAWYRARGSES